MKKFKLIIFIIIAGIWGFFQVKLFPTKDFGYFYIITSFIGGCVIGCIYSKFFDND